MTREQLIIDHIRTANAIGHCWRSLRMAPADRQAEARLALVVAAKKYDPARNDAFKPFAQMSINCQLNNVRRVSRSAKRFGRQRIEASAEALLLGSLPGRDGCPVEGAARRERAERLRGLLGGLPEREALALALYYGIDPRGPLTLLECGKVMGCSRETVRKLVESGLGRLRAEMGAV